MTSACIASDSILITFDDLPVINSGNNDPVVPNGYGYSGFTWNNFYDLDGYNTDANPSGYYQAVASPNNVAYNGYGNPAALTSSTPFRLVSAWLTAAWNDGLQVEVTGYKDGLAVYDNTYTLSATTRTLIYFNNSIVDEVYFQSWGGTRNPLYGNKIGWQFAMDNLLVEVSKKGALQVAITPSAVVNAGASWSVDGGNTWWPSDYTLTNLASGDYNLQFTNVPGWITPTNQNLVVTIYDGITTYAAGDYTQTGSLQVTIYPTVLGAAWQ
jgi:hypothetical protein